MVAPGTMTLAELQELVAESKGEWDHIEFKKSTGELQGGMETLCGFLNGTGGKVFFGITNRGKIQGQDDRLEIISSGLLPVGITVADLKRSHVSRPRNPLIAEVFYRRGLIERWGRGT